MKLDISKGFLYPEQDFPFETKLVLEAQSVFGEKILFDDVRIKGTYRVSGKDTVVLEGDMETAVHASCSLCLSPVVEPLTFSFRELFTRDADEMAGETFPYQNKELPLDQFALSLCLLHLPMRFVCRDGCAKENDIGKYLGHIEDKPQAEESEGGTYYPFAGLDQMMKEKKPN